MLDIRAIRNEPDTYRAALKLRGAGESTEALIELDGRRRECIAKADGLRHEKSEMEKAMRSADKQSAEFSEFRERMRGLSDEIKAVAEKQKDVESELTELLLGIPNLPEDATPRGADESANVILRLWGEKKTYDFEVKPHWQIAEERGLLDFERAAKLSGARFTVYRGPLARLERALISFMLDLHTENHGYTEIIPPFLVNHASMRGTGQFPKFQDDAFCLEKDGLVLIGTAEIPLTNLHRDEILNHEDLPIRYTAHTPCFRREAGAYGRDTRGIIRQHQFQKVELVHLTTPENSTAALEALTSHAETVLQKLQLPYRVMDLCTGDLGFAAARTFDLEVWLPGQKQYREISSCSNCRDFQARRAAIRYRAKGEKKPRLVHTLNGSGLAVGRTVVAILENYQKADGTIEVPEALRGYMGGLTSF